MSTPPRDLSTCDRCGRRVPPTTDPRFASWTVVKDGNRVLGMRCPACQAADESEAAS
jgi:hypothetical protein